MASDEDLTYLQPDFDPSSLTVPRLRNVLLTHGISHPSSAKKAELVQLFTDELKPKAKKILAARKRTQRSSKGIEDATSSLASSIDAEEEDDEDEEPESMPSPAKKGRERPKKTSTAPRDDSESTLVPVSAAKPAARSKSRGRSVKGKTSDLTTTPGLKKESSDPVAWVKPAKDSPFSRDNPFQSGGSSPPSAPPTSAPKRRKTADLTDEKEAKKQTSGTRRKTEQTPAAKSEATVVRRRTTKMPVSEVVADGFDPDVTEEFAPDEQAELEEEIRAGNVAVIPVRRRVAGGGGISWKSPVAILLCTLLAGMSGVWRQEKLNVGYCGIGEPTQEINGYEIPPWADSVRPQCEPCPPHATCRENMQTECDHGFVLRQNPLSLGGLWPIVPSCEPDGEKTKRVKAVTDRMEDKLRDRRAQVECGSPDASGKPISAPEMSEEELKSLVMKDRAKRMTPEEFDSLFEDSIPELANRDDITLTIDESTGTRFYSTSSLAKVPVSCSIRLSLGRFTRPALGLIGLLISLLGLYRQYQSRVAIRAEAKVYASEVFHNLAEYAAAVAHEVNGTRDGFVSVNQLRDDVLMDEFSSSKRKKLWTQVEKLVEANSNVRTRIGSLDSGDVGRGWKWIGAIRQVDDIDRSGGSTSRRASGRYSFPKMEQPAEMMGSSPMTETDIANPVGFRRWDDGKRPKF